MVVAVPAMVLANTDLSTRRRTCPVPAGDRRSWRVGKETVIERAPVAASWPRCVGGGGGREEEEHDWGGKVPGGGRCGIAESKEEGQQLSLGKHCRKPYPTDASSTTHLHDSFGVGTRQGLLQRDLHSIDGKPSPSAVPVTAQCQDRCSCHLLHFAKQCRVQGVG